MIIAILPNEKKPKSLEIGLEIKRFLEEKNISVVTDPRIAKKINTDSIDSVDPKNVSFLIAMGGDGTILKIAHQYEKLDAPILGINLGNLGFMADVPIEDIFPGLEDLLNGKYKIEKRIKIETSINGQKFQAANDIVFHRGKNPHLIELSVYVDDLYFNTFTADGMIFSTPNGSTAYSLAAGGPILSPELKAFVVTPVCPHTISNRPFVLTSESEIKVQYLGNEEIEMIADGTQIGLIKNKNTVRFYKADKTFNLVKLHRHNYFSTLRTKMNWSGKPFSLK